MEPIMKATVWKVFKHQYVPTCTEYERNALVSELINSTSDEKFNTPLKTQIGRNLQNMVS
jgi:hypothetical protein